MKVLSAQVLQSLVRFLIRTGLMRDQLWKYVVMIRKHYAQVTPPLEIQTTFEDNIKINTNLSDHIEAQIFWQGFQEADQGVLKLIKKYLLPNSVFIDVGANIGSFTLVAARLVFQGHVHAFEPSAYHYARLAKNIALNQFENVTMNQLGLYDQERSATLFLPRVYGEMNNSGAASLFSPLDSHIVQVSEDIALIRLDDYIHKYAIEQVDLIKIDIEGAELKALQGSIETLQRFSPLVIMELDRDSLNRSGSSPNDILTFWRDLNYRIARIKVNGETVPIADESDLLPHQNLFCEPMGV